MDFLACAGTPYWDALSKSQSVCLALLSQWSVCHLDANSATDVATLLAGRGLGIASALDFYLSITSLQLAVLTNYSAGIIDVLIPLFHT